MEPPPASGVWHSGQLVRLRGKLWRVRRAEAGRGCVALTLAAQAAPPHELTVLVPFDRPAPVHPSRAVAVVSPRRWRHALERLDLATTHGDVPDAAAVRRDIDLLPWQLEPLLAVLGSGASRLLIADAVGMGKTIQAGLVVAELARRSPEFRALVVTPAGLRLQWQRELSERFALDAVVADAGWLRASSLILPAGVNCWARPGLLITSMDFLKRPEVLASLESLTWDVVIVDEAHLASAATDRRAAVDAVCARAEHSLLLTATPHPGDASAFRALCEIGRHPGEAPLLVYSRQRQAMSHVAPRRSAFRRVRISDDEHRLHGLLESYTAAIWAEARRRGDGDHARLVALVLRKRALSGATPLLASVVRRLKTMRALEGATRPPEQSGLPLDEPPDDDDEPVSVMEVRGLGSLPAEVGWLEAIADAARRAASRDSKERWLRRFVTRVREPVIVFTEYRDTLSRLAACLSSTGRRVGLLHGGLDRGERDQVQQGFNQAGFVLLATDAAAEGLNLHRRCRLVVHYELPWRLGRLIQRAGRVDRLGQQRRVHEIALVADDTAEQLVLLPLARRALAAAQAGTVSSLLTESQVAAHVFDDVILPATRVGDPDPPRSLDLSERAGQEALRLVRARLAHRPDRRAPLERSPIVATRMVARAARAPVLHLAFAVTCTDVAGRDVHSELVILRLAMDRRWRPPCRAQALRALCGTIDDASRHAGPLATAVLRAQTDVLERACVHHRRATAVRRQRLLGIAALPSGAARRLIQPGLFDARAVRAAASADADAARLGESVTRRLDALQPGRLEASVALRAVLVAAGSGS